MPAHRDASHDAFQSAAEPHAQTTPSRWPRRAVIGGLLAAAGGGVVFADAKPARAAGALDAMPEAAREKAMRRAIAIARRNPAYPYGAVIARIADGRVMAEGINDSRKNPMLHGEIAAIDEYVRRHGNRDWAAMVLTTTAEPCTMCMSALIWTGIGGVIFGTSLDGLARAYGSKGIDIAAAKVAEAAPFWHGDLVGGVLANETDPLFMASRRASR
ncbi:MAG TPA: nucleoside deaminase [Stellaceae bacterium]|jgi:tRNA(Arg) A34 adenosine deaminase TadA|nr:nucleoside deaminase [Stellaceae bacterium]